MIKKTLLCDRCGETITNFVELTGSAHHKIIIDTKEYDLCDECFSQFAHWLNAFRYKAFEQS